LISETQYPKVFGWIKRFNGVLQKAKAQAPKPTGLKGDVAAQRIFHASYAEKDLGIDQADPLGLQPGTRVEIYPTDSGSRHHDEGRLVGLSEDEAVLSIGSEGKEVRVHFPRTGFRIKTLTARGESKL
jgi:hypothetical protein